MVSNCERCVNRTNCEEKDNFKRLSDKLIKSIREWDRDPSMHSYFSFDLRCDYFYPDKVGCTEVGECKYEV